MNDLAASSSRSRRRARRKLALVGGVALLLAAACAGAAALWLRGEVRGSLPRLGGEWSGRGLDEEVRITRDDRGVPEIAAGSRADALFALGFLHGQERFFQMDLSRRSAAGELAELFGELAVGRDREARAFGLRALAERTLSRLDASERRQLHRYTEGVNAGLGALASPPFEYLLLRADPVRWRPEDSLLVVFSMYDLLQDPTGRHERERATLLARLPEPLADFLLPGGGRWDAAVDGSELVPPPIPGPDVHDLRTRKEDARDAGGATPSPSAGTARRFPSTNAASGRHVSAVGSNAWAVSGERRGGGPALVANDMHLPISLPNTWYRARLRVEAGSSGAAAGEAFDVIGATLPGVPAVVVGSNGHVAWGFTNSYADTTDLVIVQLDPGDPERYRTPQGWKRIRVRKEPIEVKGGETVVHEVRTTIWGPIVAEDPEGRPLAARWVATVPGALDMGPLDLLGARSVDEVVAIARRSGMPAQNILTGDAGGRIAWTIAGRLPDRIGFDGRVPRSWADGTRRWQGLVAPEEVPAVVDPPGGLLWSGNNRAVGGTALEVLGDGGYALGARGRQIRDHLRGLETYDEQAMLEVQRDDRALFLDRWRRLLLDVLDGPEARDDATLRQARAFVEGWTGRAAVDGVGYRLVRGFRLMVARSALDPLLEPCRREPGALSGLPGNQWEYPLWALVTEQPPHLLDPEHESWDALLLDVARRLVSRLTADGAPLETKTWGDRNVVQLRHPLSHAVPLIGRWIDLPGRPLSGDRDMPLVQGTDFGASERLAVSPGREGQGIFHMPGGQSGHPGSPFYGAGHEDWEDRAPAPLRPGKPVHELTLVPRE